MVAGNVVVDLAALDLKDQEPRVIELPMKNVRPGSFFRFELVLKAAPPARAVRGTLTVRSISCVNLINADEQGMQCICMKKKTNTFLHEIFIFY